MVLRSLLLSISTAMTLLAGLSASAQFENPNDLIVGGKKATAGEFPYIVSLQDSRGEHFCGGTLIAPQYVLTAAHCMEIKNFHVVVNAYQLSKNDGQTYEVEKAIVNPDYQPMANATGSVAGGHDFAILRLKTTVPNAQVAPLNQKSLEQTGFRTTPEDVIKPFGAKTLTVAGWGITKENASKASDTLMEVDVPFVDRATCETSYPGQLDETMMCAGFPKGKKDACNGDSGGPLVQIVDGKALLVGVVSWGEGCARPKFYGVYSDVSSAYDWIQKQIMATPPAN